MSANNSGSEKYAAINAWRAAQKSAALSRSSNIMDYLPFGTPM